MGIIPLFGIILGILEIKSPILDIFHSLFMLYIVMMLMLSTICFMIYKYFSNTHIMVAPLFFIGLILAEFAFEITNNTTVWILPFPFAAIISIGINVIIPPHVSIEHNIEDCKNLGCRVSK